MTTRTQTGWQTELLALIREARDLDWTYEEIGAAIGKPKALVWKWAQGKHIPHSWAAQVMAPLLEAALDEGG